MQIWDLLGMYHISSNSFCGKYSFLEVGVRQVFKGGNYLRVKTINFLPKKHQVPTYSFTSSLLCSCRNKNRSIILLSFE